MESQDTSQISVEQRVAAESLVIDVDGFEGPLDVLLTLARTQKVDMRKISVLQLARQYLVFVEEAKRIRLELAADYLVMAAWLAFIKSRLLLPPRPNRRRPKRRRTRRAPRISIGTVRGNAPFRRKINGTRSAGA